MPMRTWCGILTFAMLISISSTTFGQFGNPFRAMKNSFAELKQWHRESKERFHMDMQRNNALPSPFLYDDQMTVHQTFDMMYAKGAMMNRVLSSVHFDPKTNKLNRSGLTMLQEILHQQKDLDINVAASMDPNVDNARQLEVRNLLAKYEFPGGQPGVKGIFMKPHYGVGGEKAVLRETFLSNQPAPSLSTVSGDISGSAQ